MMAFDQAAGLLKSRKVADCIRNLENLKFKPCSIDEVLRQNNLIVSFVVSAQLSKKSRPADGLKNYLQKINKLIQMVSGLLHLEGSPTLLATLLYNYSYIERMMKTQDSSNDLCPNWMKKYFVSLSKVTSIHLDPSESSVQTTSKFDNNVLIEIIEKFAKTNPETKLPVHLLVTLLSLHWIQNGEYNSACQLLEVMQFQQVDDNKISGRNLEDFFLLGLATESRGPNDISSEKTLLRLLFALCHFMIENYAKSTQILEDSSFLSFTSANYLKAQSFLKLHNPEAAVKILSDLKSENPQLQAITASLIGSCFNIMNKPHTALQYLREAIEKDFHYKLPLYSISLQYRKLGHQNAELESLNLLVTALDEESKKNVPSESRFGQDDGSLKTKIDQLIFESTCPTLSLEEALYAFARRCLELKHYQISAQKYLDLIKRCSTKPQQKTQSRQVIKLPAMRKIFLEAAYALVMAERYDDAIIICDRIVSKVHVPGNVSGLDVSQLNQSSLSFVGATQLDLSPESGDFTRKRKMCSGSEWPSHNPVSQTDVVCAFLSKADALVHLRELDEASQCLERAISYVESFPSSEAVVSENGSSQSKNRKHDSSENAAPFDPLASEFDLSSLTARVYWKKSMIECVRGQTQDAIHYSRLSLQIQPDVEEYIYNHVELLRQAGRKKEACDIWLKSRDIDQQSDPFQLSRMIKVKKDQIRIEMKNTENFDEYSRKWRCCRLDILEMDKLVLETLQEGTSYKDISS